MRSALVLALVILGGGCLPAAIPRGGGIADAKDVRFVIAFTGMIGVGRARVERERVEGEEHGNSSLFTALGEAPPFASLDLSLRVGTGGGCEVGALLGFLKLGPEVRCRLVEGDPTPVAAAGGVYWKVRTGFEAMVGVETGDHVPADLYLSVGAQRHAMVLSGKGAGEWVLPLAVMNRFEVRLVGAIGASLGKDGRAVLGVVPYVVLFASPARGLNCDGCRKGMRVVSFDERFGFGIVLGGGLP